MNENISIEDLCGLNHSSKHLEEVFMDIPFWDRQKQARYADEVCKENIGNVDFIKAQMDAIIDVNDVNFFKMFNTTSIGNLALLSLLAPKDYAEKSERILLNYIKYIKNTLPN